MAGLYADLDERESSVSVLSTPTNTASDAGWSGWSQATSPVSDAQHAPEGASRAMPSLSQFSFGAIRLQPNLTVEIPPLRASLAREYENPTSISSCLFRSDNIQELVDIQIANEASPFGILVGPSRTSSPESQVENEAVTISDLFLQQLNEMAKEPTPAETRRALSPMTLKAPDHSGRPGPKPKSIHSIKTPRVLSTIKKSGVSDKKARISKSKKSPIVDLAREDRYRPERRKPLSLIRKTTRKSTTLLRFDHEELTTTRTTQGHANTSMEAADEDNDIIIIGTAKRRHQTVLSIRSRSLSETAAVNHTNKKKPSYPPVTKSRIPPSNKKTPIP